MSKLWIQSISLIFLILFDLNMHLDVLDLFQHISSEFWIRFQIVASKVPSHSCVGIVLNVKKITLEDIYDSVPGLDSVMVLCLVMTIMPDVIFSISLLASA